MEGNSNIERVTQPGPLVISRVYTSAYQKEGTVTAEIKQTVTTKSFYPSKQIANDMQDNVFSLSDFGFEKQEYVNNETRVAWMDVPLGTTPQQVADKLGQFPSANLYRVLSNTPILTGNQEYGIAQGLTSKASIANSQVVRYPQGHPQAGQIALDSNGKVQYRAVFFSKNGSSDIDERTADASDSFKSPEIEAELSGATANMAGQSTNATHGAQSVFGNATVGQPAQPVTTPQNVQPQGVQVGPQ